MLYLIQVAALYFYTPFKPLPASALSGVAFTSSYKPLERYILEGVIHMAR
ncbi:hypothetical protein EZS27_010335 [termite gut metagenome]|uniref:Uncharacterized protein n=1 Tax=termite gut metagenome TaxID=433724 RepID=A0A5J4S6Y8_9ZZZZ